MLLSHSTAFRFPVLDTKKIISLPTLIGENENGEEIKIDVGKFGPYIRCGKSTKSIPPSENIFELSIEKAIEILNTKENSGKSFTLSIASPLAGNHLDLSLVRAVADPHETQVEPTNSNPGLNIRAALPNTPPD